MGRKSKLTEAQWAEVERRMLEGESRGKLGREFGISEAAIRQRKGSTVEKIKSVANQLVTADRALKELPIGSQRIALTFAAKLQTLGDTVLDAGVIGAANAKKLNELAKHHLAKVTTRNLGKSGDTLKGVDQLTDMANNAAEIPLRIIGAQKDQLRDANRTPPADKPDLSNLDAKELEALESLMDKAQLPQP